VATRADDLSGWSRLIVSLASSSPSELQPFQRGQVASLVTTSEGAAVFATAEPTPRAKWLCSLISACDTPLLTENDRRDFSRRSAVFPGKDWRHAATQGGHSTHAWHNRCRSGLHVQAAPRDRIDAVSAMWTLRDAGGGQYVDCRVVQLPVLWS
jgi:hypothetical protein